MTPILMYHSIGDRSLPHAVDRDVFAAEMTVLDRRGYAAVTVAESIGQSPGSRSIALTFDDGYEDNLETALPILQAHGFRATVFVVTDFVDAGRTPWHHASLSWSQCRELHAAGIEIGSHSRTHPDLRGLGSDALDSEIAGSKAHIEDRLGTVVQTFAYPFGYVDITVKEAVQRAGYQAACAVRLPRAVPQDRYALERIGITRNDTPARFRVKLSLPYRWLLHTPLAGVMTRVSEKM